ncbi:MAG TPA: nucleoside diphosphate kinase regulator [Terriglobia bacterium]|jgi:regulator of nucleoside diphosphate kinase|nr:nucleoside diphosphate kinase regulator [Terriglobia bacterium]
MSRTTNRTIVITESNRTRLEELLGYARGLAPRDRRYLESLEEELDRAEVVAANEIPPDVVTMNSRVRVRDLDSGMERVYTIVFPRDADPAHNRISILAPIGTALLGYRVGDVIEWEVPAGTRRLRVEEVLYQPEAAGERLEPSPTRNFFVLDQSRA